VFTRLSKHQANVLNMERKMADSTLVLNDVLCFLVNKFTVTPCKTLKTAVLDFYSAEELADAKVRLVNDIKSLKLDKQPPHIPVRRSGDSRLAHEANDLFTLLIFADEAKIFDRIPKYVAGSPDSMPSLRLYEGDMQCLLEILRKLDSKVSEHSSVLAAISRDVLQVQARARGNAPAKALSTDRSDVRAGEAMFGNSDFPPLMTNVPAESADCNTNAFVQSQSAGSQLSWAALSSTPVTSSNRFVALASANDDNDNDGDDDKDERRQYTVVSSRRKSKRARQHSSPQPIHVAAAQPRQQQQQRTVRRASTLIGKATNVSGTNLTAARRIRKKAVFCVDNVNVSCSVDDIRSHVSNLLIPVISCFEAQTRRRRDDTVDSVSARKAFRLCIYDDDRGKLLNVNAWPESVTVAPWFFKGATVNSTDKRPRPSVSTGDDARDTVSHRSTSVKVSAPRDDDINDAAAAAAVASSLPPADADQTDNADTNTHDVTMMSNDNTILTVYEVNNSDNMAFVNDDGSK